MQAYAYNDLRLELQIPVWYLWAMALLGMAGAILCAIGALVTPARPRHHDEPV
jgi:hypothetical protein